MKKINIIYWVSTGLFAAFMLLGSIPDVIQHPQAVEMVVKHLGYPAYFLPYLGVAKLLGVAAILYPGLPRLKEWAYAVLHCDLVSAMYSAMPWATLPSRALYFAPHRGHGCFLHFLS